MYDFTSKPSKSKAHRAIMSSPTARAILAELASQSGGEPVTRARLRQVTGLGDRAVREAIERLRNAGVAVVSTSRGAGYRLATSQEEVRAFVGDMRARAVRALRTARKVARAYGLRDQLTLPAAD